MYYNADLRVASNHHHSIMTSGHASNQMQVTKTAWHAGHNHVGPWGKFDVVIPVLQFPHIYTLPMKQIAGYGFT